MKRNRFFSAKNIATLGVLLALVLVLQSVALVTTTFLATPISLVMIPIVLGAVIMGPIAGGVLGLAFALICIIFGASGVDAFTALLLSQSPFLTVLTCLLKGIAAGIVPALLYKLIAKKNRYVALFVAAASAPIVNTGIFILGALCMWGVFEGMAADSGVSVIYFIVISVSMINFLIEFGSTVVAAPAIYRVTEVVESKRHDKKKSVPVAQAEVSETEGEAQAEEQIPQTEQKEI